MIPASGSLGAYLEEVQLHDIIVSESAASEFRQVLVEKEVLFMRGQDQDPLILAKFARRFGAVLDHEAYIKTSETEEVQILESTAEKPSKIEKWHSDMTFMKSPPNFTVLQARVVPAYGGDTLWASATLAFKNLSSAMREFLSGLTAEHDFRKGFEESLAEPGGEDRLKGLLANHPPVTHPLIRTHPESGRKALFLNSLFTTRIVELEKTESEVLLEHLVAQIVKEENTVRLSWEPGTVAMWDNRSTQHKPVNDFFPMHRLMQRITLAGEVPYYKCSELSFLFCPLEECDLFGRHDCRSLFFKGNNCLDKRLRHIWSASFENIKGLFYLRTQAHLEQHFRAF